MASTVTQRVGRKGEVEAVCNARDRKRNLEKVSTNAGIRSTGRETRWMKVDEDGRGR